MAGPPAMSFAEFLEQVRDEPIYVILGVQGSGTNLLARRLTKVFNFSVLRDQSMVFNAAARLGPAPTKAAVERAIRAFETVAFPSAVRLKTRKVLGPDRWLQGVMEELRPERIRTGADFARLIYAYRAYRRGTTRMAIKSDDLWENVHLIDQVIPNRRIVLLTRDFRDNLLSITGKAFGPVEPLCAATYVKRQLARYAAEYRRAGANSYHVKFESLADTTAEFVDDFGRRFGLTPVGDAAETVSTMKFRPNKVGKWKRLSERELAWCEGILHDELTEFGYPIASASPAVPGPRSMWAAIARDRAGRVPQRVRQIIIRMQR